MPRSLRLAPLVALTALLVSSATAPLLAVGPWAIMFYGGSLKEPLVVFPGNPSDNPTSFIWSTVNGGVPYASRTRGTLPPNLEGRPYVSVAIFWARRDATAMKPSDASQHGRIYLPSASAPAAVVITPPNMVNPAGGPPNPVPVPTSLEEFVAGWTLSADGVRYYRNIGPIF